MNNRKTRTRCKICVVLCKMFYDVNDILVSLLLECFAPFSCVFIVHFEQVNFCWDNGSFNTLNAAGCSSNCQKNKKNYRVLNVYLKKVKCYFTCQKDALEVEGHGRFNETGMIILRTLQISRIG